MSADTIAFWAGMREMWLREHHAAALRLEHAQADLARADAELDAIDQILAAARLTAAGATA